MGHGIQLREYGLRTAWFAAENKLRDVFYGFEYYIFHIYAAVVMTPDPEAGVNMDSFPADASRNCVPQATYANGTCCRTGDEMSRGE